MYKKAFMLLTIFALVGYGLKGQSQWDRIAASVEQNHPELEAARKLMDAQITLGKTGLTPNNPNVSYGYMPGHTSEIGVKQVYGIEQQLAFPTVYYIQKKVADKKAGLSKTEYEVYRQQVLFEAQQSYIEYIYLLKLKNEYTLRYTRAQDWMKYYDAKYKKSDASIMEFNKARIQLLAMQSQLFVVQQKIQNVVSDLRFMTGLDSLDTFVTEYQLNLHASTDSLGKVFVSNSREVLLWKQNAELSHLKLNNAKHNVLPNITLGYESEEAVDGRYSGVRAGISVPLWQDKSKIKYAKLEVNYQEQLAAAQEASLLNKWRQSYTCMQQHSDLLTTYQAVMSSNIKLEFLDKALKLGEISIINYFMELSFYYETIDTYLLLEKTYYTKLSEVEKYTL